MTGVPSELPETGVLLTAAVSGIGGAQRPGQVKMAEAVHQAMESRQHLAVQAGTGTGKSLAYLVPAVRHALGESGKPVVISTATIALQRQLIERDLPRLSASVADLLGREPVFAILKGRRNYLCLNKVHGSAPEDPADSLFDSRSVSATGRQVTRLHEWAATTDSGDRDELVPGVDDRAWRQVSVNARECIGAAKCPFGSQCFAELARESASEADIVVTNHALLAIDAIENNIVLPEHDVVVIDEAHDLVDRVTSVASGELSAAAVDVAARRCSRLAGEELSGQLRAAGEGLELALADTQDGRLDVLAEQLEEALAVVRDAAAACAADLRRQSSGDDDADRLTAMRVATVALDEVAENANRIIAAYAPEISARLEVVWLDRAVSEESSRPDTLRVAPLQVGGLLAERLFKPGTVILTSATLTLGGSFEPLARQWGLPQLGVSDRVAQAAVQPEEMPGSSAEDSGEASSGLDWTGLDVGSPFDHKRSAILYVARHLPPPGRDGLSDGYLTEMRELIEASGGRTLGLFSSMRAARQAADALRAEIGVPLLCQGEDSTGLLVTKFAEDETSCLFGTLSLWQGVDVPGRSLQLVVIDRIPFPRPDDPLASARQRAVAARGGNGFMAVAASQAALLLAQGTGRLLRTVDDRGVIAILDPRLATARYGSFLRASLPPYWSTYDPKIVRSALRRLAAGPANAAADRASAASPAS
ncbi:MAG TPA: ATP-dependent DNA helicase [Streptosporangiaceae bacterium]|nr:ATP-dependent DNA helicase [Streptosporangiaceae bacterium]